MPSAEIIAIGTELLLGEIADTNTRTIARSLRDLGIDLFRTQTIGDNSLRIADAVHEALERANIIITTGGLGPTVDDPTRQAIADSVGRSLEFHPELWEQIRARITRNGRVPTENQKRQAYIPQNAVIIENPVGTAPAFIVTIPPAGLPKKKPAHDQNTGDESRVIISLPGVPREMETLLANAVIPYLQKQFRLNARIKIRTLHVSGLGEGVIDDRIGDLEKLLNPTVGLAAHSGVVDIRITAKAESEAEIMRMIAAMEDELRNRLGDNIFGADEDTLEVATLGSLKIIGWDLACLEVNLEGALLARLDRIQHPSYRGGSNLQAESGSLTDRVESIRNTFTSSAALGIAYSQEGGKQEIDIVLITPQGTEERHLSYGGHPGNARRWAVNTALDLLRRRAQESA